MLAPAPPNTWGYITGNALTTRPVYTSTFGTSITPGNNVYGAYTSILAGSSILYDCYGIWVNINSIGVSTAAKDAILTIGVDPAGGTSYVDLLPHLLCAAASQYGILQNGFNYYFPVFIKAGSQLAAKASVNNATVGTARVAVQLFGQPSRPEAIWYGRSVEAIGINAGTSAGTAVTAGTTSEGAWTLLGTAVRRCAWWQVGFGHNVAAMANAVYHLDLSVGNGSNGIILQDVAVATSASETVSLAQPPGWRDVPAGASIYGRAQGSGAALALSMAAYGVRL